MKNPFEASKRKCAKRAAIFGALTAFLSANASATLIVSSVAVNENVPQSGFTDNGPHSFFSVATAFNQFNTALGTLNSAILSWSITGHIIASGNLEVQAALSYNGKSVTKNADTDNNPPNDVDFGFIDSVALSAALVEGIGTFNAGNLVGTVANAGGLFPWAATLSAVGNISVTYDYTPTIQPPSGVPEPTSLALIGLGLSGLAFNRRRIRK